EGAVGPGPPQARLEPLVRAAHRSTGSQMAGDAGRLVEHRTQALVDLLDCGELRLAVVELLRISGAQAGQRIAEIGDRGGGKDDGSKATSHAKCGHGAL